MEWSGGVSVADLASGPAAQPSPGRLLGCEAGPTSHNARLFRAHRGCCPGTLPTVLSWGRPLGPRSHSALSPGQALARSLSGVEVSVTAQTSPDHTSRGGQARPVRRHRGDELHYALALGSFATSWGLGALRGGRARDSAGSGRGDVWPLIPQPGLCPHVRLHRPGSQPGFDPPLRGLVDQMIDPEML